MSTAGGGAVSVGAGLVAGRDGVLVPTFGAGFEAAVGLAGVAVFAATPRE